MESHRNRQIYQRKKNKLDNYHASGHSAPQTQVQVPLSNVTVAAYVRTSCAHFLVLGGYVFLILTQNYKGYITRALIVVKVCQNALIILLMKFCCLDVVYL